MAAKMLETHVLLRHRDVENIHKIDVYLANDGYAALKKALNDMQPTGVAEEVKVSGLRGRGGVSRQASNGALFPKIFFPNTLLLTPTKANPARLKTGKLWRPIRIN